MTFEFLEKLRDGIDEFYRRHFALNEDNWDTLVKRHYILKWWMKNLSLPVFGYFMRRISKIDGRDNYSQAHIFPINRDLNYEGENLNVVLPVDFAIPFFYSIFFSHTAPLASNRRRETMCNVLR